MGFAPGHLGAHPLPSGICGALSLTGYQLLAEVGGTGAGRLGSQAFLIVAPDPAPGTVDLGTQIVLHQARLRDEAEASAYVALAAQLGLLRLSGYRVSLERAGLRSTLALVNPATGAVAVTVPERIKGRLLGGGVTAGALLETLRGLPPAGPPPDLRQPEVLRETLLALALGDDSLGGVEAAETADRALTLMRSDGRLDPQRALEAAKDPSR
ncbi:hypothetical protein [Conexibacter sp. DBS9H8]|uniref:hypothetical protein n=1 Tax=Conexibacter sp. DBS9H8 TaxID=2937801 RepID=UPI00200D932F|nr:hypothetical protein [Conexibacter sp. DBS9H8]